MLLACHVARQRLHISFVETAAVYAELLEVWCARQIHISFIKITSGYVKHLFCVL